jgi:diguanylate cyclase (GGDEF)-like protein
MRKNKTFSITVPNVAGYIFKTIKVPNIVLDNKNKVNLANNAALDFIGSSIIGKNAAELIKVNEEMPAQSFFDHNFENRGVTALTPSGEKDCDMLLTVERDKYDEALCKVIVLRDMTEIYTDALTGIYNRRFLSENLTRSINHLSRSGDYLTLMMIDIDFFKKYNDTYGHAEGDHCLKMIAETLSQTVRNNVNFVARYGGEEFTAVLPNTDEAGAHEMAEKLLEDIRKLNIPHEQNAAAEFVTVSIGVAVGIVEHGNTGNTFIKQADEMLYKSKQNGRNQYSLKRFV